MYINKKINFPRQDQDTFLANSPPNIVHSCQHRPMSALEVHTGSVTSCRRPQDYAGGVSGCGRRGVIYIYIYLDSVLYIRACRMIHDEVPAEGVRHSVSACAILHKLVTAMGLGRCTRRKRALGGSQANPQLKLQLLGVQRRLGQPVAKMPIFSVRRLLAGTIRVHFKHK